VDTKKRSEPDGTFRPFKNLKALIESRSLKLAPSPAQKNEKIRPKIASGSTPRSKKVNPAENQPTAENETRLFMEAMADVQPIPRDGCIEPDVKIRATIDIKPNCDAETLLRLDQLVRYGKGFVVSDTPEYVEGVGHNVHPEFSRRLHRGDFSIQAHLDLHGLGVLDAKVAFDQFFKESISTGKRAVLVVHGRGLSSPEKPVLKTRVIEWLTSGPWRRWVIAYTSARSCDGGAGATYVLLRQRPLTRRFRKRKKRK